MYNWEQSAKAHHKKVKKTGTVVLHKNDSVDTAFDRLLKPIIVQSELFSREETAKDPANAPRAPLMRESTIASLQAMGFTALLPSQAQCYRGIFNRRDVILHSRTGSGKTLAYALPLIERHFILKEIAPAAQQRTAEETEDEVAEGAAPTPFLLIFVSTMELAVQTRTVLSTVYPTLAVCAAGYDDVAGKNVEVLVGTVRAMDELIRGKRLAAAATAAEDREASAAEQLLRKAGKKSARPAAEDADEAGDLSDDDEDEDDTASVVSTAVAGVVSAAKVHAIVVDEVDATLGPRFTNLGRRMKNLMRVVRRANGSLTAGLLSDFRAHHYVLCGATIPNWVIKAGFLGVKKYYYQLVSVGTEKLPSQLHCMRLRCPPHERVETVARLLDGDVSVSGLELGRVIVFGSVNGVEGLAARLARADAADSTTATSPAKKGKKAGGAAVAATTALASSTAAAQQRVVRVLTPTLPESARISAMEDFNNQKANVLLCTDIATRGLDFVKVDSVVMLSTPTGNMGVETFVHRAGRTARVGQPGSCIVLYDPKSKLDLEGLDAIAKGSHVVLNEVELDGAASASKKGSGATAESTTATKSRRVQLTVRNPFKFKPQLGAVTPPTALEVLKKQLSEELYAELEAVQEASGSGGEVVTFAVPSLATLQRVKESLRKYNVKEL